MINQWLKVFKTSWTTKDIDQVLDLFADDVEYWETPYQKVENKSALRQEWSGILKQDNINLDLEVFSSLNNKHSILWKLSYTNEKRERQSWAGVYLVELDSSGKSAYFLQTGEKG